MARGDLTLFEEFANQLGSENHSFENGGDTIKVALFNSSRSFTADSAAIRLAPSIGASTYRYIPFTAQATSGFARPLLQRRSSST